MFLEKIGQIKAVYNIIPIILFLESLRGILKKSFEFIIGGALNFFLNSKDI